jgi:hypothetical protein
MIKPLEIELDLPIELLNKVLSTTTKVWETLIRQGMEILIIWKV